MKKIFLILLLVSTTLFVGCQNSGTFVDSKESPFCTACKSETVTTFIQGLNHTKYKCPSCETAREYDDYGGEIIHTCVKCGSALEKCPICIKREG